VATTPPGRTTRASSRAAFAGLAIKTITNAMLAASKLLSGNGSA
jgi:hypothetical protein